MLVSNMYLANNRLRQWIKAYWIVEGNGTGSLERYHLIPDGCATMVLILEGSLQLPWYHDSCMNRGAFIVPPNTEPHHNLISDNVFHIDIQLNPGVFNRLFRIPPEALGDRVYDLEDLSIRFDRSILEQLWHLRNTKSLLIEALDQMMDQWFDTCQFKADALLMGVSRLYQNGNIDRFFSEQGLSIRQIQRNVKQMTGMNPKSISRISRFYTVLEEIKNNAMNKKINYLNLEDHFADQSHFIREFKSFTGITPSGFLFHRDDFLQFSGLCSYHTNFSYKSA